MLTENRVLNSPSAALTALIERGVVIHAPAATLVQDIDPERFEAGAEIFPGCTIRGRKTLVGRGARLGRTGGGYFEDVAVGRGADLYGGYFKDAVFLDGVVVRGHAEMRGGTLMEEGSEVGHHVGFKMTIMMPNVVAGSLINFCDVLVAGGTSRRDHSEIGSCLALYNFTPWGDKFASLFGDVPRGVFLRERRIFVGGQTQIVSPVHVGYGSVIPAGAALRRSVGEGRLFGQTTLAMDDTFDSTRYGGLLPKFSLTAQYIGQLRALAAWYRQVRLVWATSDSFLGELYRLGLEQVEAGIAERMTRLDKLVKKLPASRDAHLAQLVRAPDPTTERRIAEHARILDGWPTWRAVLACDVACDLTEVAEALTRLRAGAPEPTFIAAIASLDDGVVSRGVAALQAVVRAKGLPDDRQNGH